MSQRRRQQEVATKQGMLDVVKKHGDMSDEEAADGVDAYMRGRRNTGAMKVGRIITRYVRSGH